ncbi:glycosyltransferase, partial [Microbacterium sp. Bi128]|uniref:glycosyltransferase n=1 Tax=Microbacterium sp. Bi128 TaxID=2821115 RepID=UPI001E471A6C
AEGSVIWTGTISSGELKWAYENCRAFLFPSLDEGFGLPVLEAVNAGARIALSDIPAFREFGDVGVFFDPEDDDDIASSIAMLLHELPKRAANAESMISWETVVTRLRNEVVKK